MKEKIFMYVPFVVSLYLIIGAISCSDDVTSTTDTGERKKDGVTINACRNDTDCAFDEECINSICQKKSQDAGGELPLDAGSVEELTDIVVEDTTGDIGLDAEVEDIIDTGDGGADAGGCPGGCGSNASCVNGECVCNSGYGNCNNDWADGCEVNTTNDINNCGGCGNRCEVPNAYEICVNSVCQIDGCYYPYGDCDRVYNNGCEVNLNLPTSCGTSCTDVRNCGGNSTCTNGECGCISGYGDCNNSWSDGCEMNVTNDVKNCGRCGNICDVPNADEICVNGVCQIERCYYPYKDRDGQYNNGCEAREEYFPKTYGGSNEDVARSIQQTKDSGYIVAGYTRSFGAGSYDMWVLKLDSSGGEEGQRTYGGIGDDYAYSIQETTDDGYIVAGTTASFGAGSNDIWILKLNSSGQVEWQRSYGGIGDDVTYSIQQTTDGGYIVAGATASFGAGSNDIWILKLNSSGQVEWQRSYGGANHDYATSIKQTTDGGYIVAGATASFGAGESDMWILKLNSSGEVEWQRSYGGSSNDVASSIQQTRHDGGYIVAGYTTSFGAGSFDLWVLKLNSSGQIEWQRSYGGSSDDYAFSIKQTADGKYIVAGHGQSVGAGGYDLWVLKLNSSGQVEWQRSYGGISDDGSSSIQLTRDGRYIVAGATKSFGAGNWDFWVLKLKSDGSIDGSCPSSIGATTNATPNPTFGTTTDTTVVADQTSATVNDTSATVQDTSAATDTQCSPP